jgi:hypothetical protein
LLFNWRQRRAEDGRAAGRVDDEVIGAAKLRQHEARLLGRKTLHEALSAARPRSTASPRFSEDLRRDYATLAPAAWCPGGIAQPDRSFEDHDEMYRTAPSPRPFIRTDQPATLSDFMRAYPYASDAGVHSTVVTHSACFCRNLV